MKTSRKMRFLILSLFAVVSFGGSCSPQRGKLESKIVSELNTQCFQSEVACVVDLDFIDWVDWDTLTVFSVGTDNSEINKILGENSVGDDRPALSMVLALSRNGQVVYLEDDRRNIEGYDEGDLEFTDIDPVKRFVEYHRKTKLEVSRLTAKRGTYFTLRRAEYP